MHLASGFAALRDQMVAFLSQIGGSGRAVTERDVKEFFAAFNAARAAGSAGDDMPV